MPPSVAHLSPSPTAFNCMLWRHMYLIVRDLYGHCDTCAIQGGNIMYW